MRLAISRDVLSLDALVREVEHDAQTRGEGCGGLCSFVGVVRATHKQRRVRYLEYEAFEPLALTAFGQIEQEIGRDWPQAVIAIHHRIGRLEVGEASVVKQIAPVWKHEFFEDGDAWVEGAVADPNDDLARQEARRRACA